MTDDEASEAKVRVLRALRIIQNRCKHLDGSLTLEKYGDLLALDMTEAGLDKDHSPSVVFVDSLAFVAAQAVSLASATTKALTGEDVSLERIFAVMRGVLGFPDDDAPPAEA